LRPLCILYLSQYFPPEVGATQSRSYEMVKYLVDQGHKVTVVTEIPNHPKGVIHPDYKGKWYVREEVDGIDVRRVWVWAAPRKTFLTRMMFYLSFMFSSFLTGLFAKGRYDLVFATSPPFFVGASGLALSFFKRAKFIFEARDLWPESAVALNELKNPFFIAISEKLERLYYCYATHIVVVTKGIRDRLISRGLPKNKISLIPNGSNPEVFHPMKPLKRDELELKDKFVVGYAGILGIAQGMEILCELIEAMKMETDICFLFIGEGPKKEQVRKCKVEKHLDNLILLDEVPRLEIAKYIACFDVALVPLKKCMLFEGAVPTKMFDCMACEKPVILAIEGEAHRILEQAGAGLAVTPESVEEMQQAILTLRNAPETIAEMAVNGRSFVAEHRTRLIFAQDLERLMNSVVFQRKSE